MRAVAAKLSYKPVLVVEDEQRFRDLVRAHLEQEGFSMLEASDAQEARRLLEKNAVSLVVLDVGLPGGESGLDLCRWLRTEKNFQDPIIFLTARDALADKVLGLETGGDDYITKPFAVPELIARVRAQLRWSRVSGKAGAIRAGVVEVIPGQKTVSVGGKPVPGLTQRELDLLGLLLKESPRPVSRDKLLVKLWGYPKDVPIKTRTIDVHIQRLREKLGPRVEKSIQSVTGISYRFVP